MFVIFVMGFAALLGSNTSPLLQREKLYLLAVGYYRSNDYSKCRMLLEQCLEVCLSQLNFYMQLTINLIFLVPVVGPSCVILADTALLVKLYYMSRIIFVLFYLKAGGTS